MITVEWIECAEKLPPVTEHVLGYFPEIIHGVTEAWSVYECFYFAERWYLRGEFGPHRLFATHWMPMPQPPTPAAEERE